MKFIHAADLHLDSPMHGLERYDGAPVTQLRGATRRALENLVQLGLDECVDFVLIAGDVYDGDWKDYNTGLFFAKQMARFKTARIRVFLIRGNHDASSQITKDLRLPDNVYEFSTKEPETIELEELQVAIHGQGFSQPSVTQDLAAHYPFAKNGWFNIGVLHTSADGRPGHERYAPCSLDSLKSRRYDYWALGHVHQREILSKDPWIVFPGNTQGRNIRENSGKGCTLVDVVDGVVSSVEHVNLDVVRWQQLIIDAASADSFEVLLSQIRQQLIAAKAEADGRLLAVRLLIKGRTRAQGELSKRHDQLINECRAFANEVGPDEIWLELVQVRTRAWTDYDASAEGAEPIGDLLRFIRDLRSNDKAVTDLLKDLEGIKLKLPPELLKGDDAIPLEDLSVVRETIDDAEQLLLSRLLDLEETDT